MVMPFNKKVKNVISIRMCKPNMTLQAPGIVVNHNWSHHKRYQCQFSFFKIFTSEVNDTYYTFLKYQNVRLMQHQYEAQQQTIRISLFVLSLLCNLQISGILKFIFISIFSEKKIFGQKCIIKWIIFILISPFSCYT